MATFSDLKGKKTGKLKGEIFEHGFLGCLPLALIFLAEKHTLFIRPGNGDGCLSFFSPRWSLRCLRIPFVLSQVKQLTATIPKVNDITFSSATSSLASCNRWPDALSMLGGMTCIALRPHDSMYNSVATSLEKSGHWSIASALFEEMICTRVLNSESCQRNCCTDMIVVYRQASWVSIN